MFKSYLLVSTIGFIAVTSAKYISYGTEDQASLKIINGQNASISQYPFMASLSIDGSFFGAGVILNENWILTPAYNVLGSVDNPSQLEFRVGSSDYGWYGQAVGGAEVIVHKKYQNLKWDYDIAVVRVNESLTLGQNVSKAVLATKQLSAGTVASVAGWGTSYSDYVYTLLAGNVTVYDFKSCKKIYEQFLTQRMFCTFDQDISPCTNDWGDPLVVRGKVYGLYAGAFNCNPGSYPALYTNLAKFNKWINNAIKPKHSSV